MIPQDTAMSYELTLTAAVLKSVQFFSVRLRGQLMTDTNCQKQWERLEQ